MSQCCGIKHHTRQKSYSKQARYNKKKQKKRKHYSIPILKLWEVLRELNINNSLIKALQNLYGNTAQVKTGNKLLFKMYIRKALEEWKRKCYGMGIPLGNITLYTLQSADDEVGLASDKEDLEHMTRKLKETYEKWGIDMNLNKENTYVLGENETIWNWAKTMKLNCVKDISI
jgi:hypothetical protein